MTSRSTHRKAKNYAAQHQVNYTTALRAITGPKARSQMPVSNQTGVPELGEIKVGTYVSDSKDAHLQIGSDIAGHVLVCSLQGAHTDRFIWSVAEQSVGQGFDVVYSPYFPGENSLAYEAAVEARMLQMQSEYEGSLTFGHFPHHEITQEINQRYQWLEGRKHAGQKVLDDFHANHEEPVFRPIIVLAEVANTYPLEFDEILHRGSEVGVYLILVLENSFTPSRIHNEVKDRFATRIILFNRRLGGAEILDYMDKWGSELGASLSKKQVAKLQQRPKAFRQWVGKDKAAPGSGRGCARFDALITTRSRNSWKEVAIS